MKIRVGRRLPKIRIFISTSLRLRLCRLICCMVRKVSCLMFPDRIPRCAVTGSFLGGRTRDLAASNRRRRRKLVSKGCVAVYVGEERRRFVIPIVYLSHPFIATLLAEAEGYDQRGPLRFPCGVDDFEQLKWLIDRQKTTIQ